VLAHRFGGPFSDQDPGIGNGPRLMDRVEHLSGHFLLRAMAHTTRNVDVGHGHRWLTSLSLICWHELHSMKPSWRRGARAAPERGVAGEFAVHVVAGMGGHWYTLSGAMRTISRSASGSGGGVAPFMYLSYIS